ncbi:MAG: HIT domain-containing protein [Nanoarchaeota archaeon]
MAITKQQAKELKAQLIQQISNLPPERKAEAEYQINSLSEEALESMLDEQQKTKSQRIFRLIVEKQIPSVKLDENSKAIAVLSTKSISKGHTIIIPKNEVEKEKDMPKEVYSLAEELSKKLINSLKAKSTSIISEKIFGETIIHIIPIYDKPLDLKSKREDLSAEQLEKIKLEINVERIEKKVEKIKIKTPSKIQPDQILKLKRRVP